VRKAPEVLVVSLKDVQLAEWLMVRMCFVLVHVRDEVLRDEFVRTMGSLVRVWKEANPSAWSDLRKCTEAIKSFIYSLAHFVALLMVQ
jgi:hypothetical protein